MLDGELAVGYHTDSVGVFVRDTLGKIRKVGPAHVGISPPEPSNYTQLSDGELWVDRSGITTILRYYDEAEDNWESTSILDSSLNENQIIVGDTSNTAQAYELDSSSFFVDHTEGVLEVRLSDSPEFGSYGFVSENGVSFRTVVFKTTVPALETDWYELEAFDKTLYRSGKYVVEVRNGSTNTSVTELLVCHDGTDTYYTEYGSVGNTIDPLGEFRATIVNVGGTDTVSLQFKRAAGVSGDIIIRSVQTSLF
jgi:hypothetical protein